MADAMRLGVIGAGLKATSYARSWAAMPEVSFVACADVSTEMRDRFLAVLAEAGRPRPNVFDDYRAMLAASSGELDAVYVSTPHAFHAEQAMAVAEAGLDLLLEKPMVTTVAEAQRLNDVAHATGSTIVVAFQGPLSPLVRDTRQRAAAGRFGDLVSISATIWEDWAFKYAGGWKQVPALSGGGFMFDTGAHMMNTVCLLAGSDFECVSAYMNARGRPVDIVTAVAARLADGTLVTLNAAGEGPPGCASHIVLFYTEAIVRIDAWGQWREIETADGAGAREHAEILANPLKVFMDVRAGRLANPSTVANGLRFSRLWDAIKASAARNGEPMRVG